MYVACLTCAEVISHIVKQDQFGYTFHKPLLELGSSEISKNEFDSIWDYYHSRKKNMLKKTNDVIK